MGKNKAVHLGTKKNALAAPALILATPEERDQTDPKNRVLIFERDGIDYTIEKKPNMGIALGFLRISATRGDNAAAYFMLNETLGEEGYLALETYPELTDEHLQAVLRRVQTIIMGGLELPKVPST